MLQINIDHLAKLARLRIEEEQLAQFESDMRAIAAMVKSLPDVEDNQLLDVSNPMTLREDRVEICQYSHSELLKNAPQVQSGCVVVPKTVE